MSTRAVNADRRGPKDLMDLAQKAQAFKELKDAQAHNESWEANSIIGIKPAAQKRVDDAFEHFADLHRHPETGEVDTADMQNTIDLLNQHIAKGKWS